MHIFLTAILQNAKAWSNTFLAPLAAPRGFNGHCLEGVSGSGLCTVGSTKSTSANLMAICLLN